MFLDQFLRKFLGWAPPRKKMLTELFDEEKLYAKIAQNIEEKIDLSTWLVEPRDDHLEIIH